MVKNRKPSGTREKRNEPVRREEREPFVTSELGKLQSATVAELFEVLPHERLFPTKRSVVNTLHHYARDKADSSDERYFEHGRESPYVWKLTRAGQRVRVQRNGKRSAARGGKKGSQRAIGQSYIPADEKAASEKREPFAAEMDPNVIDRGRLGHKRTQNLLARLVQAHGMRPLRPQGEPKFDVAWWDGDRVYVVEVKSLTKRNEEKQLRLGLGQVLRYRQLLQERSADACAVLALEREPGDKGWHRLCRELDVVLWWPGSSIPSASVS